MIFIKIAKNVWKDDLEKDPIDLHKIGLYVKPEENKVYCVANDDVDNTFSYAI